MLNYQRVLVLPKQNGASVLYSKKANSDFINNNGDLTCVNMILHDLTWYQQHIEPTDYTFVRRILDHIQE